jgi:predicted Zn-dependent peptidase
LQIEAERLTSVQFAEDQLKLYAEKCAHDVDKHLEEPNYSLSKYGLMAFNQAYNHGITEIPVYGGVRDLTVDDVQRYRRANYRLSDMVVVVAGDFDPGRATELINKYFGSIVEEPLERTTPAPADEDIAAQWDLPANVMFFVYPGPYRDEAERIVLTMFGNFLSRQLKANNDLLADVKATFCSGTIQPVGDTPFFVFVQIHAGRSTEDVRPEIITVIEESLVMIDKKIFDTIKINLVDYFESSLLESQRNFSVTAHHKALEQEAVNIAMRHYLRNGATTEEFVEKIRSITYEDARRYLDATLTSDNRREVVIKGF